MCLLETITRKDTKTTVVNRIIQKSIDYVW